MYLSQITNAQHRLQRTGGGVAPRPRGFSPENVVRPLAFSRQFPRPPLKPAVGRCKS
jgi:hypothetical protein